MQGLPKNTRAIIWCAVSGRSQASDDHYSMADQEAWGVQICKDNEWSVIDILRVPGHSRNYRDFAQLAQDARASGIDAFDKLSAHFKSRDFDVIVVRDVNRLARSASLVHWMLETIIDDCGAMVYSRHDGWITSDNVDGFAAIKGYSTAKEIKWIKDAARRGKKKLLESGLPIGPWINPSHVRVRDSATGKDTALIINESARPLFDAIVKLLLQGVAWVDMGAKLYHLGYISPRGKIYSSNTLYGMMYNPMLWGHMATRHRRETAGMWIFEPNHPIPEGVDIAYNVIDPFFDEATALRVKAELVRRWDLHGRAKPHSTTRFSGTCVCGVCGRSMSVYVRDGRAESLRCPNCYRHDPTTSELLCTNTKRINHRKIEAWWTNRIMLYLDGRELNDLLPHTLPPMHQTHDLEKQLSGLQSRLDRLIDEQSLAPDIAQPTYRKKIEDLGKLISDLLQVYEEHKRHGQAEQARNDVQNQAMGEIRKVTLNDFWRLPDVTVNQYIKRLLGGYKLVVMDGEIVGVKKVI